MRIDIARLDLHATDVTDALTCADVLLSPEPRSQLHVVSDDWALYRRYRRLWDLVEPLNVAGALGVCVNRDRQAVIVISPGANKPLHYTHHTVLLHELTHLWWLGHSPGFWRGLNRLRSVWQYPELHHDPFGAEYVVGCDCVDCAKWGGAA